MTGIATSLNRCVLALVVAPELMLDRYSLITVALPAVAAVLAVTMTRTNSKNEPLVASGVNNRYMVGVVMLPVPSLFVLAAFTSAVLMLACRVNLGTEFADKVVSLLHHAGHVHSNGYRQVDDLGGGHCTDDGTGTGQRYERVAVA